MPAVSILKAIELLAAQAPDKAILIEGDRVVTRAEFDRATNRLARAFAAEGVVKGDFVSITLPNSIAFLEAVVAAWKIGAVPQPLPHKMPAKEFEEILRLVAPRIVVGDIPSGVPRNLAHQAELARQDKYSLGPLPDVVAPNFKAMISGGSTGRPKVIVAGNPGVIDLDAPFPTIRPNERFLLTGPLYHNAPFLGAVMCMLSGGSVVVNSRFDAVEMLQLIDKHQVNFITLVPTMMHRVWRLGDRIRNRYDMSSIRAMIHSAAPCPTWLKEWWIDWLGPERVLEAYSNTEAPGYTYITGNEWLKKRGSVGRPEPSTCEIMIRDADGVRLAAGEVGEIYMRPKLGENSTYCYGKRYFYIGATPRITSDGWESMGDLGYVDEDGYLFLADRRSDIIIRGGANIYPAEIEAAIERHPSVRTSVVIGIPDDEFGETVKAIVDADRPISENELRNHLKEYLSPFKIPATFEFVSATLRNDAGKVCRRRIRQDHLPLQDAIPA